MLVQIIRKVADVLKVEKNDLVKYFTKITVCPRNNWVRWTNCMHIFPKEKIKPKLIYCTTKAGKFIINCNLAFMG